MRYNKDVNKPDMTLLDYFAGQALVGLIEGYDHEARMRSENKGDRTGFDDHPHDDSDATYASQLAHEAYIIARAMLAVRTRYSEES